MAFPSPTAYRIVAPEDKGELRARPRRQASAEAGDRGAQDEAALRTAEAQAREFGVAGLLPWVFEERAALALALGDESRRRAAPDEARRLCGAIGAIGHLQRLQKEAGQ